MNLYCARFLKGTSNSKIQGKNDDLVGIEVPPGATQQANKVGQKTTGPRTLLQKHNMKDAELESISQDRQVQRILGSGSPVSKLVYSSHEICKPLFQRGAEFRI